ncbi:hypothetical protein [Bacillus gaemokensis]|uniref:Uncharacterized protein n=1 Tax=Bacillus gaemokensis TaxID=574375 RepID=A0A073K9G1_9BACI|nr:hypothetical protein [Bacillus gaemokensis]KEK23082.1 hypothetical protein BAGA_13815 [Bacillus gaemokensis]KYG37578.1 hypothetical protein AZF08_23475 [Bacillus gaemokensis]
MTWLIILGFILLLNVSSLKSHSIHVIFKINSDKKATPNYSFVNKINFQLLKELLIQRNINNLKDITLGELFIPLDLFNRLLGKTLIFLILFFYSQYFS